MTDLARNIRTLRERRGLTQAELGQRCGVGGSAVAHWESGKWTPRSKTLAKIASALGVAVGKLFAKTRTKAVGKLLAQVA